MRFYHNPRCSKSRQALALLEERNVELDIVRYLEVGIVKEDLALLASLDGIVRKKEAGAEAMAGLHSKDDVMALLKANTNERGLEHWNKPGFDTGGLKSFGIGLTQLRKLAKDDKPFFLQYWPLYPLVGARTTTEQYTTPNGGTYVEKMKLVDKWIGELMAEMETLGVAKNTLVIVMGDNGHFTKYSPQSGYTPMIYKGGKGSTTEGGVRVDDDLARGAREAVTDDCALRRADAGGAEVRAHRGEAVFL